jgi:phosphoenolpyruvate carboxykinase (GTP)
VRDNLEFGKGVADPPGIFSVNYFLKDRQGRWLNEREDKRVWLKWMELRVHGNVEALKTPTGRIPVYDDLKTLFATVLSKEYGKADYVAQFTLRLPENIRKTERILKLYREVVLETPPRVFEVLERQKDRLLEFQRERGDYVSPFDL